LVEKEKISLRALVGLDLVETTGVEMIDGAVVAAEGR
jgi:hypothetical protein